MLSIRTFGLVIVVAIVTSVAVACLENVRKVTYGPDFKYVEPSTVTSTMQQFASFLKVLDQTLADEKLAEKARQEKVIVLLNELDGRADKLFPAGQPSNHPDMSDQMQNFKNDLRRATTSAKITPPNYYWAGRVAGSCGTCHVQNR